MSEMSKTMTFVAVALVALAAGWVTRPSSAVVDVKTLVGGVLAKNFNDPGEAKRLRIVKFDEDSATLREFEVAEQDGLWTIPSKNGYPADAEKQMAEAATSLMDRKILGVASENAGDHEQYGVIDPQSPKLEVGQKGVGTHVTMSDIHKEPLVDLIVGKEVKDSPNQHYVREAGRDVVYVVDLNPERLSTNFEDWIEKDLLKLSPWEIREDSDQRLLGRAAAGDDRAGSGDSGRVGSAERDDAGLRRQRRPSGRRLSSRSLTRARGTMRPFKLADDEELNAKKLDELKTSLDDLKIVDVVEEAGRAERRPEGGRRLS